MKWYKQNRLVNREKSEVDARKRKGIRLMAGKDSFSSDIGVVSEGTENTREVDSWEVSYPLFVTSSYVLSRDTDVLHVPENCAC